MEGNNCGDSVSEWYHEITTGSRAKRSATRTSRSQDDRGDPIIDALLNWELLEHVPHVGYTVMLPNLDTPPNTRATARRIPLDRWRFSVKTLANFVCADTVHVVCHSRSLSVMIITHYRIY